MRKIRFHELVFDSGMLSAQRDDGTELRFTRLERALLLNFTSQPGKLLSRAHLVELLSRDSAEMGERNVDFLVNRLRARLGDNARNPRFIATHYGEGYAWIAKPFSEKPITAFLVIGPVHGLDATVGSTESRLLVALTGALQKSVGENLSIHSQSNWIEQTDLAQVQYSMDVSFHQVDDILHAALVLRHASTRRVIGAVRTRTGKVDISQVTSDVAEKTKKAIWSHLAVHDGSHATPLDAPLHLRMHARP